MNDEQLQDILTEVKPAIIESLKDQLKESVTRQIQYQLSDQVNKFIADWLGENVMPEIADQLVSHKEGLVKMALPLSQELTSSVVAALASTIAENLTVSYKRSKIFDALFS